MPDGTVVGDAGGAAGSTTPGANYLTELGITNTGTPLCINDALINAAGGYHQLCLGASGGLLSYQAFGGAAAQTLTCNINGSLYACFPSGGNVAGPNSSTAFNIASYNGGTGKVVQDSGIAAQSAQPPNNTFSSWLNTNIVQGKNPYGYLGTNGLLVSPNNFGEMGVVGASQSSQVVSPNVCCSIGVAAIGINNNTATPQSSWVFYGTGSRIPGAGSLVNELDIYNGGTLITSSSYASPSGQTVVLAAQCGGEPITTGLTGNHCSAGITLGANGDTLNEGLVVKNNAISGPNTPAIEMAASQSILWTYDNTGPTNFGAQISSLVSSNLNSMSEIFTNTGVAWKDHAGNINFLIANNPGVTVANFLDVMGQASNNPVLISAQGTDANINIQLFPKGPQGQVQSTGSVLIGNGAMTVAALEYALGLTKQASPSGIAPGAGVVKIEAAPGTSGGTCKLVIYAGTSASGITPSGFDNLGSGC